MSATTTPIHELPHRSRPSKAEPLGFRFLAWCTLILDLAILGSGYVASRHSLPVIGWELAAWGLLVAVVGLVPVPSSRGPQLGMDLPLLLAAAFLFGPVISGAIAFAGYLDLRELRGQITLTRALYNRAQTSLSVMAAAATFLLLDAQVGEWPRAAAVALVAISVDCVVNYSFVTLASVIHDRAPSLKALSRLHFGRVGMFALCYGCFGFLGLMLAEIRIRLGAWGLVSFVVPLLLARETFSHSRKLEDADDALYVKERALREASERIADERRDERLTVAAGLHDEVLPPLYQVHLMGQVLRQDLLAGKLLALEDDLPELLRATECASEAMRVLIRDLKTSSLGPGGLAGTLRLLASQLDSESDARIQLNLDEVRGSPLVQLLAYQVGREALRNAIRHSGARHILIHLTEDHGELRLVVKDDGRGFVVNAVDRDSHFGLDLMRARAELAGGACFIASEPGYGTRVTIRLPSDVHTRNHLDPETPSGSSR